MAGDASDQENRAAAYHESGHIVIASALGLSIGPKGISIDNFASGLAWFWGTQNDVVVPATQVDNVVVALFAGGLAHQRIGSFRPNAVVADENHIQELLRKDYLDDLTRADKYKQLQARAKEMVDEHWSVIVCVAEALWALPWTHKKPHSEWPKGKSLSASELLPILAPIIVVIDGDVS